MIDEAAAYAKGKRKHPPPELALYFECQMWGTLPRGRSLADIPIGLRARTRVALNIYSALKTYQRVGTWKSDEAKTAWYNENTDILELIDWIEERTNGSNQ